MIRAPDAIRPAHVEPGLALQCRWQGSATADSRGQFPSLVGIRWRPVLLAVEPLRPHRRGSPQGGLGAWGSGYCGRQLHRQDVAVALAATRYESRRGIAPCHRVDTKVEQQHSGCRPQGSFDLAAARAGKRPAQPTSLPEAAARSQHVWCCRYPASRPEGRRRPALEDAWFSLGSDIQREGWNLPALYLFQAVRPSRLRITVWPRFLPVAACSTWASATERGC